METKKLEQFKQLLIELKAHLEETEDVANQAAETVTLDQSSVGRLSRMDAMQSQAMAQENVRRRQAHLKAINVALSKIQSQEFGECEECGESIAVARLEFDPAVTHCINCAQ